MQLREASSVDLSRRRKTILENLTVVEAPRVMVLFVTIIVAIDFAYAAMGIVATPAYYLSDLGQSLVLLVGAWLIQSKRMPARWAPATFMTAVVANNVATTYQSTVVGHVALAVIATMLSISGAVALSYSAFLAGAALCIGFTTAVLYQADPTSWVTWTSTMVTATAVSLVVLYGRSESALGLARAQIAIEHAAIVDPLTGLLNRRGLQEESSVVLGLARRAGQPFWVAFLDIAGLKHVNDTHGHGVGDLLLVRVAHALSMQSRASELLCRWGGDEFLLVGMGDAPDPMLLHARLETAIDMRGLAGYWKPELWIGAAQSSPGTQTIEQVVLLADHDMYERRSRSQALHSDQSKTYG